MKEGDPIQISQSLRRLCRELTVGLGWLVIWLISNVTSGGWRDTPSAVWQSYDEYMEEKGYHKVGRCWVKKIKPQMTCLQDALEKAGIFIDLPAGGVKGEELGSLCEELGLTLYSGDGNSAELVVGDPLIVIYKTRPGFAHAEFAMDARGYTSVVGIIKMKENPGKT